MSNEYKDWQKDRREEAWEDMGKIAELIRYWQLQSVDIETAVEFSKVDIARILEKGGWI